jgi:hypothetical protein
MKRTIALLCSLLLICFALSAFADTIKPNESETLRALIAGKSFSASIAGWESFDEENDTKYWILVTICERDQFDAAEIENLKAGDMLCFGNGQTTKVTEVKPDELVIIVKGSSNDSYSFNKTGNGTYLATTDTDYPFWTEIFTIRVPLEKDVSFLDWSDPENLEAPVQLGFSELLMHLEAGTNFSPYNTDVTFDENGKLAKFLYSYSPFN